MMPDGSEPMIPWYKTTAGKIFVGILAVIFSGLLLFSILVGSYLWRIKFGDKEKLAQTFSQQFTFDPSKRSGQSSNALSVDPRSLIRPFSPSLGSPEAPVTILAFMDFQCPFSQASFPIFEDMLDTYGSAVRVVFKHVPISQIHPEAFEAHLASACANEQGQFWPYYRALFTKKQLDKASLLEYARALPISQTQFKNCLESKKYQSDIEADLIASTDAGVRGTPTYTVNQLKLEGVVPRNIWDKVILEAIKK